MLVLSRKPGEKIVIGDGIEVVLIEVRGNAVRLGIVAPDNVKVYRQEVLERIERERALAEREKQRNQDA